MRFLFFIAFLVYSVVGLAQPTVIFKRYSDAGGLPVNTGTQYRLAYYEATGRIVSNLAAITGNRALISDANGLPTHSTVTPTELGYLTGVTSAIQTQLGNKQALDADLTAIAALSPANDDIIQRKGDAWVNRTIAQLKADLSISGSNTGDQDLSTLLVKSSNLSDLTNAATARSNLGATTVGGNFFTLTNPSAVRFIKINADNTVTARTAAEMLSDIGAQASGSYAASGANTDITSVLLNQTGLVVKGGDANALTIKVNETLTAARTLNIITADANRTLTFSGNATISGTNTGDQDLSTLLVKASNLSDLTNAGTARTNLGATTVGGNLFTLTNPSAISFARINADNTVTARTPSQVLSDISAQASDADLTTWAGITPGSGVGTFLATPSSANLASAITNETGSGALVFGTSPDFTTGITIGSVAVPTISSSNTITNKTISFASNTIQAMPVTIVVAASDEATAITTGTGKITFRIPHAMTLSGVRASLTTASTSGIVTVNIKENGTTIFSTQLTIDANEKTSTTAATAMVLSDTSIADDSEITIDVVGAGTGAVGLKIALIGTR